MSQADVVECGDACTRHMAAYVCVCAIACVRVCAHVHVGVISALKHP